MQDGAFVLCQKMAHTPLKVPDDCMRMHTHGFSFLDKKDIIQHSEFKRGFLRGAEYITTIIKKCSALNSAPRVR